MNVYHEYVKNQPGSNDEAGAPSMNGGPENVNPSAEEGKTEA